MPFQSLPATLPNLTPKESILDTLHRITEAYDTNSLPLLLSTITPTTTFHFPGDITMTGPDEIRTGNFNRIADLDTTHFITNVRISLASDDATEASLTCNALAQHYPKGTGMETADRRLLGGTRYRMELVKDKEDGLWKVGEWWLEIVWAEGDFSVLQ